MSSRARAMLAELPGALLLALLTAVVTLLLAVLLSSITGAENNRHRLETRCYNAEVIGMLREVIAESSLNETIDLGEYPPVNVEGLDCSFFEDRPPPGRIDE